MKLSGHSRQLICFLFFLCPFLLQAGIIYVNPSASGANNGSSWADGFTSLSGALTAAQSGDEIWVKKGLYKPSKIVDFNKDGIFDTREVTFQVPNGVAVYGGFVGTESNRDERNVTLNVTILSGDIDNNDLNADANSVAEDTSHLIGNNAFHVVYTFNVSPGTMVDGFIITAGKAHSANPILDANQDGAGWYNRLSKPVNASSPTVVNTIFCGNHARSEGGAMYNSNAEKGGEVLGSIRDCKFIGNRSNDAGGAIYLYQSWVGNYKLQIKTCAFTNNEAYRAGGAIFLGGDHIKLDSSIFENNKATAISKDGNTLTGSGGAVYLTSSNAAFSNCMFKGNKATGNPTGYYEDGGGGALYFKSDETRATEHGTSAPTITSCGFYANIASDNTNSWGGAVKHLSDGGKLSPTYVNCIFAGNQAQDDGGAIANYTRVPNITAPGYTPFFFLNITNCTFVKNHANKKGGAIYTLGYEWKEKELSSCTIENTIIWDNNAGKSNPEVYFEGKNWIAGSLIKGSGGSGAWQPAFGIDGGNNIDANPGFVNINDADGPDNIPASSDDGLKLSPGALAINKGNNAAVGLAGITKDFQSLARINGGKVDMGAYERGGIIPGGTNFKLSNWKPASICLSCTWAFIFNDKKFEHFVWDGPAQLIESEGSATITGRLVNAADRRMSFDVFLELINKTDWQRWSAQGGTYTAISAEAKQAATRNHVSWSFWELSSNSYIRGAGELSGELTLHRLPAENKSGFQTGVGANGWDADLGLSGSFVYEGIIANQGTRITFNGVGSVNVDAVAGLEASGLIAPPVALNSARNMNKLSLPVAPESTELSVFPMPAHTSFQILKRGLPPGSYTLKFYNSIGQLKRQDVIAIPNGMTSVPVNNLVAGPYILQLVSQSGEIDTKKIIIN